LRWCETIPPQYEEHKAHEESAILNLELSRIIFPFSFFLFPSFRGASATKNEKGRMKKEEFRPKLRIADEESSARKSVKRQETWFFLRV
jgi:hypothetical protein